jgi:hypothetical protein
MAVVGIFAKTDVRDDHKRRDGGFDGPDGLLYDSVLVIGSSADRILFFGDAE